MGVIDCFLLQSNEVCCLFFSHSWLFFLTSQLWIWRKSTMVLFWKIHGIDENADFCLDKKLKGLLNMHLNEHTTFHHCEDEWLLDISSAGLLASHFMCRNLLITSVSFQARDYHMYIALFEILSREDQTPSETYHDVSVSLVSISKFLLLPPVWTKYHLHVCQAIVALRESWWSSEGIDAIQTSWFRTKDQPSQFIRNVVFSCAIVYLEFDSDVWATLEIFYSTNFGNLNQLPKG